jgi:hypothetical protein
MDINNSVYINVGKEGSRSFTIKKSILSDASPVFRRMIENEGFTEAATGVLNFPDDDPALFCRSLSWLKSARG